MALVAQNRQETHPFEAAHEHFSGLVATLSMEETSRLTHADVERLIHKEGTETMRLLFQGFLDSLGKGEAAGEVVGKDGGVRSHIRLVGRSHESVFGAVRLERTGYSQREISPAYPLDARLNLPVELYSHEVSRRVAVEVAKSSFNESVAAIGRTTGASVPKRQAQELTVKAARDFDAFYEDVERAAAANTASSGEFLIQTFDGKGIVMRKEDLREATRKAAEQREPKLSSRMSKGEKRNAKRMAEVAAVYTIDPHVRTAEEVIAGLRRIRAVDGRTKPPKPQHKRVWASVEKEMEDVIEEAFREAQRRDPDHNKPWVNLVDGNREQLAVIGACAKKYEVEPFVVIDFIHVLEYLWDAGHEMHGEGPEAEEWVLERALRVLRGEASLVAGGIGRSATMQGKCASERKAVDACVKYLVDHAEYLRYDICLAKGYPIATGVIEGACRSLVKDRMDLTGARWGLEQAEAVLKLRALRASGDFDDYWAFHEKMERQRNHEANYRKGVPEVILPARNAKQNCRRNLVAVK